MKRSLVLGGGGIVGVAWLVGVVQGLADKGLDLTGSESPDEIIGTSAGSIVGSLVAHKRPPHDLREMALDDANTATAQKAMEYIDMMAVIDIFGAWAALPNNSAAELAKVGMLALRASTVPEHEWHPSFTPTVGTEWPTMPYGCTAVNAATGDYVLWGRDSGVPLDLAVASSCTVPGIFPAVTIGDHRYVDGGLRSGTSADLSNGSVVLVLAPIGSNAADPMDAGARKQLDQESQILRARGVTVIELLPDAETNAATLVSPLGRMDPEMRMLALDHGVRQGQALAASLTAW